MDLNEKVSWSLLSPVFFYHYNLLKMWYKFWKLLMKFDQIMQKSSDPDVVSSIESQGNEIKRCADCGTSKTPLWRGGPAGPKVFLFLFYIILSPNHNRWMTDDHHLMGFSFDGCDLQSLCNACGIRSRKKRRAILGLKSEDKKSSKKSNSGSSNNSNSSTTTTTTTSSLSSRLNGGTPLHQRLLALGREVMMQRSTVDNKQQRRRKLGEEEQAAVLLMALSYGSVYA